MAHMSIPCHEGPPATKGHFSSEPAVAGRGRYYCTIMSANKMYSNDSLGIVMWDHRPAGRFAPHGKICAILRAAIKSRFFADMLSLRM